MMMTGREFQGKTALVTGAGSGIGRACALQLASAGAFVGLLGRSVEPLQDTLDDMRKTGGDGMVLLADVSRNDEMKAAVQQLISLRNGIDAVVANAGINGVWAPIDNLTPQEFDATIAVNVRGTYLTLHHAIPYMKERGGAIVVVSSINGTRSFTTPGATAYAASKAAQVAMVQQLSLELGRYSIRINAVCPGAITTEIDSKTKIRLRAHSEIPVEFPQGDIPLTGGVAGRAEDVAQAALFLLSDAAGHITGSPLWIDGGQGLLR